MESTSKFYYFDQHDELFVGEAQVTVTRDIEGIEIDVHFLTVFNTETNEMVFPYTKGFDRDLFAALQTAAYECDQDSQMSAQAEKYWAEYQAAPDEQKVLIASARTIYNTSGKRTDILILSCQDRIVRWKSLDIENDDWHYPTELPGPVYDYLVWIVTGCQPAKQAEEVPDVELANAA